MSMTACVARRLCSYRAVILGENIALGKQTSQGPNTFGDMVSGRAVDGNTNEDVYAGYCAHPTGTNRAYWTVNLGGDYILKGIRIYNRDEQNLWNRKEALKIIGNPTSTTLHDEATADPKLYNNIIIDVPINSRAEFSSITIQVPKHVPSGGAYLSLCEVEIYYSVYNCSIITNPPERSWNIRSGTGDTDTATGTVTLGSVLEFTCIKNYKLNGPISLLCMSSGSYDKDAPTCTEIMCSAPSDIANGEYTQQLNATYSVGAALTWQCKTGYISEQRKQRVCTNTTEWSGQQPMCFWITCPFPGTISNGELKRNDGTTVYSGPISNRVSLSISCDVGHRQNVQNITCTLEGQWDAFPECQQVTCDSLGLLTGGYFSYNNNMVNNQVYVYGTIAIPVCNEKLYKPGESAERNLTCGQNGEWTGGKSSCVALCQTPLLKNGAYRGLETLTKSVYETGESIVPLCDERYHLSNPGALSDISKTCQEDHSWDGPNLSCTLAVCEVPQLQYGTYRGLETLTKTDYEKGESIVPLCKEGYKLTAPGILSDVSRTCQANFTWDGPYISCIPIEPDVVSTASETCSHLMIPVAAGIPGALLVGFAGGMAVMYILSKRKKISSKPQQHPDINATYCIPNRDMIDEGHVYLEVNEILDG